MVAPNRHGPVGRGITHPIFNVIVLKQMSLLCEISYLFNSKNASAEHLIELDEVICLSVRTAHRRKGETGETGRQSFGCIIHHKHKQDINTGLCLCVCECVQRWLLGCLIPTKKKSAFKVKRDQPEE